MKRFIELKRHLHLLTLPITLICLTWFVGNNVWEFAEIGSLGASCIAIGASAILGYLVEAKQGFQGANRTRYEMIGAYQDMITCIIGGAIACVFYFVLNLGYWLGLIIAVIIGLMELYRQRVILKKHGAK